MEKLVGQATLARDDLLEAAGLLVDFTRAEADVLYMNRGAGEPTPVLDMVGGFGSTLLGHNHPEIRQVLLRCIEAGRPVHAQGSNRTQAGVLREALADRLKHYTGHDYKVMLLNTGTEAVEAALKHAQYEYCRRLLRIGDEFGRNVRTLRTKIERGEVAISEDFMQHCERVLGQEPLDDLDGLLMAVAARNQAAFNQTDFVAAFKGAFHGKTRGSLALTWNRDARLPFIRNNKNAVFIDDCDAFSTLLQDRQQTYYQFAFDPLRLGVKTFNTLSAIVYEPIQGEGGICELCTDGKELLHAVKRRYPDVAVIADEIQCGLGRCGSFLESQAQGLPNDYITFAKSLGGGYAKISAVAIRADRYRTEFSMLHSSTFADDDLSAAIAKRTLEIIERDGLPAHCERIGQAFLERFHVLQQKWPGVIKDVRGKGTMLGVELQDLSDHDSAVIASLAQDKLLGMICAGYLLHEKHVRVLPSLGKRDVLRLEPSAYFKPEYIEQVIEGFDDLCQKLAGADVSCLVAYLVNAGQGRKFSPRPITHPARHRSCSEPLEKVGFIAYLIGSDSISEWDPSLAAFDDQELDQLRQQMQNVMEPQCIARRRVRSPLGKEIEFVLYGVLMDAEAIEEDIRFNKSARIRNQVVTAYNMAREDGCSVVGFGGYTSIVTANCTEFDYGHPAVTTGNALTVATSLATVRRSALKHGVQLERAHVAVGGATGNIGSVHAALLAHECGRITLIGRPASKHRLLAIAEYVIKDLSDHFGPDGSDGGSLKQRFRRCYGRLLAAGVSLEKARRQTLEDLMAEGLISLSENPDGCRLADVVVAASNSSKPFLLAEHFAPDKPVVVSDVAIPGDVHKDVTRHLNNVRLIRGGVVQLPNNPDFDLPGMLLNKGEVYACAAETLLLGLAGIKSDFSKGAIGTRQIREIEALAKLHGFELDKEKLVSVF